jgi:hypothetical protein
MVIPPNGNSTAAVVTKTLRNTSKGVRCAFDFMYEQVPQGQGTLVALDFAMVGYSSYTVYLSSWNLNYQVTPPDGGAVASNKADYAKKLLAGLWTRVALTVDFSSGTALLSFDGDSALGATLPLPKPSEAGGVGVLVGARWPFPNDTFTFRYDNILCDLL